MFKLSKTPDQYVKGLRAHWHQQRHDKSYTGRRAGPAINDCWRPSNEASKADLLEFHRENIRSRLARRGKRSK